MFVWFGLGGKYTMSVWVWKSAFECFYFYFFFLFLFFIIFVVFLGIIAEVLRAGKKEDYVANLRLVTENYTEGMNSLSHSHPFRHLCLCH